MLQIAFSTFAVQAPREWADITEKVSANVRPDTLARREGVGALQFSIALYEGGAVPNPTPGQMRQMVEDFGRAEGLGEPSAVVVEAGPPLLAAGSFAWRQDFLRVWHVSDGRNFAFITYTCGRGEEGAELPDCEQIVRTIAFGGPASPGQR